MACYLQRDGDFGAAAGDGVYGEAASGAGDALADAGETEVSLGEAGEGGGVEAAAVVLDREEQPVAVERAGDVDRLRLSVADGVGGEFAHDAHERVGGVV